MLMVQQAPLVHKVYRDRQALTEVAASSPAAKKRGKAKKLIGYESYLMVKRETLEFVRAYYKIEDEGVRMGVYQLTTAMGAAGV